MKKKVLFMLINMNVGGTEKALLTMLSEIPKDKYDITLLLLEEIGGFMESIPDEVEVIHLKNYDKMKTLLNDPPNVQAKRFMKQGQWLKAANIIKHRILAKVFGERKLFFQYVLRDHHPLKDTYDVAIAYAGPMDFISYYIAEEVTAKKKVQWIHFDITKIGFNRKFASKTYQRFDNIFVVSDEGKDKLISFTPRLKNKIERFSNILSQKLIVQLADEGKGFEDEFQGIRILTVGRLSKEKGQDLSIPVLAKLKAAGYEVRWYCVGDGQAKSEYQRLIKQYKVENDYILLGADPNPYPYMKQCDLYVQSSRHEGYCITLAEARCFDNPIITTHFTGAKEQITHGETGLIVEFDQEQMFTAIKRLLDDALLRKKLKKNLRNEKVDTTVEMERFYHLVDN
ncbi:glycosyl transferase [Ammoniphilus oxalaticus]|uniref:Glycosyl transferase n=1 Tax=Ammoniphilus oxalaticus TaxID=66863 RepID=A0A419SHI7_9BACL|nr:glycosyltransferase [Ammoniphilus oxalaticus]RKD23247.1 glycosyl transferase [Ammoniphilus oxalaticus]